MKSEKVQRITYHVRPFEYVRKNGIWIVSAINYNWVSRRMPLEIEFYPQNFDCDKEAFKYDGKKIMV